jgi:hypothetical protein
MTANESSVPQGQHFLKRSLEWLCRQQLITGELPAYRRMGSGDLFCWPSPLISALACEALACADPRAATFSRRLHDLLPPADRRPLTRGVVTLRWRLRCYVAAQESGEGLWKMYGRDGDGDFDPATSACAASLLMEERGGRLPVETALARKLLGKTENDPVGEAMVLRLLALTGSDVRKPGERLLNHARMTSVERVAVCWALAHAWWESRKMAEKDWSFALLEHTLPALGQLEARSRLGRVLGMLALLRLGYAGPEVEELARRIRLDPEPPWRWKDEPLHGAIESPALMVSLMVCGLARSLDAGRNLWSQI